jgi:hypothetical protein
MVANNGNGNGHMEHLLYAYGLLALSNLVFQSCLALYLE